MNEPLGTLSRRLAPPRPRRHRQVAATLAPRPRRLL